MRGSRLVGACLWIGLFVGNGGCGGDTDTDSNNGDDSSGGSGATSATGGSSQGASGGTSTAGAGPGGGTAGAGPGGGTGGTGNASSQSDPFESDLPGDTPVDELPEADFVGLCEAAANYVLTAAGVAGCRYYGAYAALQQGGQLLQTVCSLAVGVCEAAIAEQQPECQPPTEPCPATVAEVEACTNDLSTEATRVAGEFPECSELTEDTELPELGQGDLAAMLDPTSVGSCAVVSAAGPGCAALMPEPIDLGGIPGAP